MQTSYTIIFLIFLQAFWGEKSENSLEKLVKCVKIISIYLHKIDHVQLAVVTDYFKQFYNKSYYYYFSNSYNCN